jgi:hypothetical protein
MSAQQVLEQLTEVYAKRDLINIAKQDAIPADVKKIIEDNDIAFSELLSQNAAQIAELESQAKEAVLAEGETIKCGALQAVYAKGRVSWDSKKLDGMMIIIPELSQARKQGEPSVSIRKVG